MIQEKNSKRVKKQMEKEEALKVKNLLFQNYIKL